MTATAPASAAGIEVRSFDDVDQVPPAWWDPLVGPDDPQASRAFIRACQRSGVEDAKYRHVVLLRGGEPEAIATFSCMTASLDLLAGGAIRGVARTVRSLAPGFLRVRVAFCGLPVSFAQSCLRWHPAADAPAVVRRIAGMLEAWARERGCAIACLKEFGPAAEPALAGLDRREWLAAPSLPTAVLDPQWPDFGALTGAMRSGYRRQVRRTEARATALGLALREAPLAGEVERIVPLYHQVMDRAANQLERLNAAFLHGIAREFGPAARALLLERAGRTRAAAVVLDTPAACTWLLCGLDHDGGAADGVAYPALLAAVVRRGLAGGPRRLELGQTSEASKTRLGARLEPRTFRLRCLHPGTHRAVRALAPALFPARPLRARRVFRA